MSAGKGITLDANIFLRAVFGVRVFGMLEAYEDSVVFSAPDVCFADAQRNIPIIARKRGTNPDTIFAVLERLSGLIQVVDRSLYEAYEASARARIGHRDMDDWPIVATALFLNSPIWTEDQDFFGIGIATWTTRTIELYLQGA